MRKISSVLIAVVMILSVSFLFLAGCARLGYYPRKPATKPPTKGKLPSEKVDLELSKLLTAEQQVSRENMRRLAEGQIKSLKVEGVTRETTKATVKITSKYIDNSTLGGFIDLIYKDGRWYLSTLTRESRYPRPATSTKGLSRSAVEIGKQIVIQQRENQEVIRDLIDGKIKSLTVDSVNTERDRSVIGITVLYTDNSTAKGTARLIYKEGFWYLSKITRKP